MSQRVSAGLIIAFLFLSAFFPASNAFAGKWGKEIWIATGASWPDYGSKAMTFVRGGVGAVFMEHFALGISAHADSDRSYYFGDVSVIAPGIGIWEPYGRFQVGRRDDGDDTAMAWVAGFRTGEDAIRFFVEGFGIFEPEDDYGISAGISF